MLCFPRFTGSGQRDHPTRGPEGQDRSDRDHREACLGARHRLAAAQGCPLPCPRPAWPPAPPGSPPAHGPFGLPIARMLVDRSPGPTNSASTPASVAISAALATPASHSIAAPGQLVPRLGVVILDPPEHWRGGPPKSRADAARRIGHGCDDRPRLLGSPHVWHHRRARRHP